MNTSPDYVARLTDAMPDPVARATLLDATNRLSAQPPTELPPHLARPTPLSVRVESIPETMRAEPRWVGWRYEWRHDKWTKTPYVATAPQVHAKSTDPTTWRSFADSLGAYEDGKCDGIGFVLGDGWVGFDADDTDAADFVELLNTYTE